MWAGLLSVKFFCLALQPVAYPMKLRHVLNSSRRFLAIQSVRMSTDLFVILAILFIAFISVGFRSIFFSRGTNCAKTYANKSGNYLSKLGGKIFASYSNF